MKITYFLKDDGACGHYRVDMPIKTLCANNGSKACKIAKGDSADHILGGLEADIFVVPRVTESLLLKTLRDLQKQGRKIVVDHDDHMFHISPLSPHYVDFGLENVKYKMASGQTVDLWKDGENIDLKSNMERTTGLQRALEMADMVTTTTDILADIYREYNDNVKVLPNCIDMNTWKKLPLKENNAIRMGWYGGSSHYDDWCILQDVLPRIMKKYSQVKLVLMGTKFKATLKGIPEDRIEFHPWVPTPAYPYKAAILDLDFAIIPLQDNEFNRAKSAIKWIEQGALEVPSVTSYVSPYKEMGDESGVFIEGNTIDAWIEGISMMIEDADFRKRMGEKAYRHVSENFDINKKYTLWHDAYKEVLNV